MKRIAMLNCRKADEVCAGASCMSAFYDRRASFAAYGSEELCITAFMRCNGCAREHEEGLQEKVERVIRIKTDVVHIGICANSYKNGGECENITRIASIFSDAGIEVVRGTH